MSNPNPEYCGMISFNIELWVELKLIILCYQDMIILRYQDMIILCYQDTSMPYVVYHT